jgi:hypothetical protein
MVIFLFFRTIGVLAGDLVASGRGSPGRAGWESSVRAALERPAAELPEEADHGPEQLLVLMRCRDERHQVQLLRRFREGGLVCIAVLA